MILHLFYYFKSSELDYDYTNIHTYIQKYMRTYISGLARPQGRPQKKKTLSKIPQNAPKPNLAARTLNHGHIGFFVC